MATSPPRRQGRLGCAVVALVLVGLVTLASVKSCTQLPLTCPPPDQAGLGCFWDVKGRLEAAAGLSLSPSMDFTGAWSSPFQLPFAELSTHADGRVTRVTLVADVDAQHFDHVLPYLDLLDDLVAGSGTRALEMIRTGEEGSRIDLDEGQAQLTVWPHFLGGTEITLSDISWLPEPTNLPTLMKLPGETLTMSRGGNDVLRVVVSQVRFLSIYPDATSGIPDEPGPGNIYVEAFVEYEALDTGMSFGSSEWQVYLGEEQIADHPTSVSNGPEPGLQSGDLPDGKTASGWVVYEVPASGRLTLGYLPMWLSFTEPVGEWLLRE